MKIPVIIGCLLLLSFNGWAQQQKAATKKVNQVKGKEMPYFPGDMGKYLMSHVKIDSTVAGKEVIEFLVNTNGSLSDFKVTYSINPHVDSAMIRALKKMPKWKPARDKGKAIPMRFSLPISLLAN